MNATATSPTKRTPTAPSEEKLTLTSINKITGEKMGEVNIDSPEAVKAACERARKAQKSWAALGAKGRLPYFKALTKALYDNQDKIAELINKENGKTTAEAHSILMPCLQSIKMFTDISVKHEKGKSVSPTFFVGAKSNIYYEPKGLIGYIIPWNFPFEIGFKHMIPALAAGNAVVQKPSELNPLIGQLHAELFKEAGFPKDIIQIVQGEGATGAAVVDNCDAILFIGSTKVGKMVGEQAAKRMIPATLELGGKDAALVLDDADLELTSTGLIFGSCYNAGQVCVSTERIYAHSSIAKPLISKIHEKLKTLRVASPGIKGEYEIGPIISGLQANIYRTHLQDALDKGAQLVFGGKITELNGINFCEPTLLTGCDETMIIMQEETFGPFICIQEVASEKEMIRLTNDIDYGLSGSIWSGDTKRARILAKELECGGVAINNAVHITGCITLPFGGRKQSGIGFVQSDDSYYNYVNRKSVMSHTEAVAADIWMPYDKDSSRLAKAAVGMYFSPYGLFSKFKFMMEIARHKVSTFLS